MKKLFKQEKVIDAWSRHYGITLDEIRKPNRSRVMADARTVLGVLLVQQAGLSYPEAGRIMARNHATIIHCRRKYNYGIPEIVIGYNEICKVLTSDYGADTIIDRINYLLKYGKNVRFIKSPTAKSR